LNGAFNVRKPRRDATHDAGIVTFFCERFFFFFLGFGLAVGLGCW
jgi:hypothetical protein